MKQLMTILALVCISANASAQTLNINQGSVRYAIPASQLGQAVVSGTTITIGSKTYNTSDISNMTVDDSVVEDNTVNVTYDNGAQVTIAGNIAHLVEAKVNGAHVTLLQDASVSDEIKYTLTGNSDNGSFYMDGQYKCTVELAGVTLHNPDSAAINIADGKRIKVVLKEGTTNSLSDGITGANDGSTAHNACLYFGGHPEFSGAGSLTIAGNVKHALTSDEYCQIKKSVGSITVSSAVGDGFHIGQYFLLEGGDIRITASGDGVDVGKKKDETAENNGKVMVHGGSLTVVTDGDAMRGVKCDDSFEISAGNLDITVKGDAVYDEKEDDASSAAAIKPSASFTMTGGTVKLLATGKGGKLVNSDGVVTISGGKLSGAACGDIYVYSATVDSKAHGIKCDADIIINGGEVYIAASEDEGKAFKTDFVFAINGGTVMGIGGKKSTPSADSAQGFKEYKDVVVKSGATVEYDGVSFTVPAEYSNTEAKVVVSKPGL